VPSEYQTLREFGIRYDAFLSKIRSKTNSYLANQHYEIVDIANSSYPELAYEM